MKEGEFAVSIAQEYIEVMVKCIRASRIRETGGVLIGYYTEDLKNAVVCEVTGPPSDSQAGRYWFKRGVKGLKALFQKVWKEKQYYLGEWHFHPLGTTNPSPQDYWQMLDIASSHNYCCPEAIMIIIAGNADNYVIEPFLTIRKEKRTYPMELDI